MRLRPLGLILCLFAASPAAARAQPPAAAAAPSPALADLAFLIGAWDVVVRTPGTTETAIVRYEVRPISGSAWLSGHGVSTAVGLDARDVWGRDPATGEITRTIYDSGGTYGLVRAAGWRSDVLVLEGEARSPGGAIRVRQSLRRDGPDRFFVTWEAQRNGAWVPYSLEEATRRS